MVAPHNIKNIRENKDISQIEMAKILGMGQSQYCKIESGHQKITADLLEKIANVLQVELHELFTNAPITNIGTQNNEQNMTGQIFNIQAAHKETIEKMVDTFTNTIQNITQVFSEQMKQKNDITKLLLERLK
jgi:transcriptional regulator with XRE-family HTH domain